MATGDFYLKTIELVQPTWEERDGKRFQIRGSHYRLTFEKHRERDTMVAVVEVDQFTHGKRERHKPIEQLETEGRAQIKRMSN